MWEYVNQFAEFNNYINSPVARYGGELYNLPFNMNTFTKMWNIRHAPGRAKAIIARQVAKRTSSASPPILEEQALTLVRPAIFTRSW